MITKKKSRFLTFCFSLLPGAGQMFMGFLKSGLSMMTLFIFLIWIGSELNMVGLALLSLVVWAFSFFHANHIASLSDEDFASLKDEYMLGFKLFPEESEYSQGKSFVERYHKGIAIVLIFMGICLLWNTVTDLAYTLLPSSLQVVARAMRYLGYSVPSIVISIAIIALGVKMIAGKKVQVSDTFKTSADREEAESIISESAQTQDQEVQ